MIPKQCKRLAEMDFPVAVVSKHAAREKSIRHGHPSTLHLWWARRPLGSCRAMLLGLLLPDPCDPLCPSEFKTRARALVARTQGQIGPDDMDLRKALLGFIGDFAAWENSSHPTYLEVGRGLVKAAHPDEPPLVVDPFAGGGSIPLEALRVGCEAFASDLNPVACLILKVMLEDIPRWGREKVKVKSKKGEIEADGLAEALRFVGKEIKEEAEKELAEFYPKDPDGATPIAYLWARTVRCESPNCGAEIPLVRSFWLCKKANRKRALRYQVIRKKEKGKSPEVEFEVFEPKSERDVPQGTVTRAKATCLVCGTVLPPERVRAQLAAQRGGADVIFDAKGRRTGGARLLAVVTLRPGEQGRHYRLPTERDYQAVWKAQKRLKVILDEWEEDEGKRKKEKGKSAEHLHIRDAGNFSPFNFSLLPSLPPLCPVPDEPAPSENTHRAVGSQLPYYGHRTWSDLFTRRQLLLNQRIATVLKGRDVLPMMLSKILRHCNAFAFWHKGSETVAGAFGRQAIPMCWDFPEYVPFADFAGSLTNAMDDLIGSASHLANSLVGTGQVQIVDATCHPLPDGCAQVWFTDPPYYDAIAYADLSDFFFVWLKRMLPEHPLLRDPFDQTNVLTPKSQEAVQCEKVKTAAGRSKDKTFYEETMTGAFTQGRRILREDGVGAVVFAHKTTEGWESLLSGMIRGGWTITGSWPIATERGARLLARETAALATSVHLVCRPRPQDAPVGDWGEVLRELPKRVGDWMERLQGEGIRGADLVFACIGPALEIFSRYSKVETAEGCEVTLAEYLEKVWEVVGRTALEQVLGTAEARARNGAAGALEEDARLTALFLWTLQSTNGEEAHRGDAEGAENGEEDIGEGEETVDEETSASSASRRPKGFSLVFDVVRRFAQPLGIDLPKWEGRIIDTQKGVVRLMAVSERAKQLFGEDGADAVADWIIEDPQKNLQQVLFPELEGERAPRIRGRGRRRKAVMDTGDIELQGEREATTLDRVHAAMLLQAGGQANALRELIKAEQQRGPDFLRLANALSALYPKGSEEKRLLDAMLLAVPK